MSAQPIVAASEIPSVLPALRWRAQWGRHLLLGAVLGLGATLALAGSALHTVSPSIGITLPAQEVTVPQGLVTMPDTPVDGVLTLDIPLGASADQAAGGRGYAMPSVINLEAGDTIVIHNNDDAPHMILYTFLLPGQTDTRTFTAPGSEVYSSGCGLHAAAILNFTTIFVHEPAAGSAGGAI